MVQVEKQVEIPPPEPAIRDHVAFADSLEIRFERLREFLLHGRESLDRFRALVQVAELSGNSPKFMLLILVGPDACEDRCRPFTSADLHDDADAPVAPEI